VRGTLAAATLALVGLLAAGCSDPDAEPTAQPPGRDPDASGSTAAASPNGSPSPSPTTAAPVDPSPTPVVDVLDWTPVPGSTDTTTTTDGTWTLALDEEAGRATLTGPDGEVADPARGRVTDALLGASYAVVVHQARSEDDPSTATVTDLATGATTTLDGDTPGAPTTSGGTWALDRDRLAHATRGPSGAYCLGVADLASGTSRTGWCAPARSGFNAAHLGPDGDTLLTFDDSQPSCRTLVRVADQVVTPLPDVTPCQGFEAVLTAAGPVWSEVPDAERIEAATVHAGSGDALVDLGPGTSGTLTTCGDATWWVRDPQGDTDVAELMRWDGTTLSVAYRAAPGRSFLAAPRCGGGDVLSVSSFSEGGDAQVSATVGTGS